MWENIFEPVLKQIITFESIVIISVVIILTQLVKSYIKKEIGRHHHNSDFVILSICLGIVFSFIFLNVDMKWRTMLGIFYGGSSSSIYWILKKYVRKYFSGN